MYILIAALAAIILLIIKISRRETSRAEIKGALGEEKVNEILNKLPKKYVVLDDLLIKHRDRTSQVDHVVVGQKGIFVIETKNYKGKIYGKEKNKYWTQVTYKSKNNFYNPIWQNNGHISAIKYNLSDKHVPIFSIIVFSDEANLRKVKTKEVVIPMHKLYRKIKWFRSSKVLDKYEVEAIAEEIADLNIKNRRMRKKHIKEVRRRQ